MGSGQLDPTLGVFEFVDEVDRERFKRGMQRVSA